MKASEKAAHIWARDPLDWYVEPRRVTRQLLAIEPVGGLQASGLALEWQDGDSVRLVSTKPAGAP